MLPKLKLIVFAAVLCTAFHGSRLRAQIGSGIVVGGGITATSFQLTHIAYGSIDPKYLVSSRPQGAWFAGYNVRFGLGGKFSTDLSAFYHWKYTDITTPYEPEVEKPGEMYFWHEGRLLNQAVSIQAILNYELAKGLKVGVGGEPIYYLTKKYKYNGQDMPLDMPLVGRLAYDLGPVEIAAAYKHGIASIYQNKFTRGTLTREVQVSVYVPIFR